MNTRARARGEEPIAPRASALSDCARVLFTSTVTAFDVCTCVLERSTRVSTNAACGQAVYVLTLFCVFSGARLDLPPLTRANLCASDAPTTA